MNKENGIAIIVGLTLGVTVAVGVWTTKNHITIQIPKITFPKISLPQKNSILTPTPSLGKTTTQVSSKTNFIFTIDSPDDEIIVASKEAEIKGKITPNATLILSADDNDVPVTIKNDGTYLAKVTLDPGPNSFTLTAIDQQNNAHQLTRTLVYEEPK